MVLNTVDGVLLTGLMVVSVPNTSALKVEGNVKLVFWLRIGTYFPALQSWPGYFGRAVVIL